MVQVVMGFLDETPDLKTKLSVIEALRTVTEGKVSHVIPMASNSTDLIYPDLRRGGTSASDADPVQHQARARRY